MTYIVTARLITIEGGVYRDRYSELSYVLVHVLRTRGGLDHYTTCRLTIDV